MHNRLARVVAASLAAALVLAACGSDDAPEEPSSAPDPAAPAEPSEPEGEEEPWRAEPAPEDDSLRELKYMEPSLRELGIAMERDRSTVTLGNFPTRIRNWNRQFDEVNVQYQAMDPIPALLSGNIWMIQGEPLLVWPALDEGIVDGVLVGITNDTESWNLFTAPGIESPEDLEGKNFASGGPGWSWDTVARILFEDEYGLDIDELVNWVTVSGGSDGMMQALLAGQIDGFMGQPRHEAPILEAGGNLLFSQAMDNAQGMLLVERDTWENHYDAVCAVIEGMLETHLWIAAGSEPNDIDRLEYILPMYAEFGYDTADLEAVWESSYPFTWSFDMGATVTALDRQLAVSQAGDEPVVSADFDWRDHFDWTCVWELQEAYGLPLRPDPAEL